MLAGLPDSPLGRSTVPSLENNDRIVETMVLCGMGWGEKDVVIQFLLRTESTVYVLCYASPDDGLHENWFTLNDFEYDGDKEVYAKASKAAEEYIAEFGQAGFLEDHFGVEMDPAEKEVHEVDVGSI